MQISNLLLYTSNETIVSFDVYARSLTHDKIYANLWPDLAMAPIFEKGTNMNVSSLLLTLVIGLVLWGGWPMIANGAKDITDPFVRAFMVNVVTTVGLLPFVAGRISTATFASKGVWILILAGVCNGAGHLLFPQLQTAQGSQVSLYMSMIPALCIVAAAIGGPLFSGDAVSGTKVFFTAWILVGVVGLAITSLR